MDKQASTHTVPFNKWATRFSNDNLVLLSWNYPETLKYFQMRWKSASWWWQHLLECVIAFILVPLGYKSIANMYILHQPLSFPLLCQFPSLLLSICFVFPCFNIKQTLFLHSFQHTGELWLKKIPPTLLELMVKWPDYSFIICCKHFTQKWLCRIIYQTEQTQQFDCSHTCRPMPSPCCHHRILLKSLQTVTTCHNLLYQCQHH